MTSKYIISNNEYPSIMTGAGGLPASAAYGTVMFDEVDGCLKVFTMSSGWVDFNNSSKIDLNFNAEQAIDYVIDNMYDEKSKFQHDLVEIANKYPIVAEALGQLEVALKLCENLEDNDGDTPSTK